MKKGVKSDDSTIIMLLGLLFFAASIIFALRPFGADALVHFSNSLYVLFAIVAAAFGFWALRETGSEGPQGKFILFLTLAFVADAVAGGIWLVYESILGMEPFPSIADAIWGLFYVLAITSFSMILARVRRFITPAQLIASIVGWGVIVALVIQSTLRLIFADASYSFTERFFSMLYPIADLAILLMVFILFSALRNSVFGKSLIAFMAAFAILAIGDLIYVYQEWTGAYTTGSFVDLFWLASQLMTAYGFYLQMKAVKA